MVRRLVVFLVLALAAPSAAHAATVTVTNGQLRYTAAAGKVSNATFIEAPAGTVTVTRDTGTDTDAFVAGSGCSGTDASLVCSGVTSAFIDAGDGADRITAGSVDEHGVFTGVSVPMTITGGDGNDALAGGSRNNVIDGGAGDDEIDSFQGNDSLRGGDGNDVITPNTGTDAISGGDGIDTVVYGYRTSPSYTLDGLANDGDTGENDLIGTDVEGISAAATGTVAIVGDGRANRLTVTDGRGDITGGDGPDILEGGPLDDVIHARDGSPDTIICNGGNDTVEADTLDTVSPSCENVTTIPVPGGAFDDRPPLLQWVAPGQEASLSANTATKLSVNASDDRGLARVQFFDSDRLLCDDVAAPFDCSFAPRGTDVGRNTLLAVATDSAGQSTTLVRTVTVRHFSSPGVSLSLRPSRDRKPPYSFKATGKVSRPTPVAPTQGCSGSVTISAKRGSKTVYSKRALLTRTCDYTVTLHPGSRKGSLKLTARFSGNDVIAEKTSASRTIRLG